MMKNDLMEINYRFGQWLLKLLQIQYYWLDYTLKGLIIGGLFPATATVFYLFHLWFENTQGHDFRISDVFQEQFKRTFKGSNVLGYLMTFTLIVLWSNLQISKHFIQSPLLHYLLVLLLLLTLGTLLYLFPVYVRYELPCFYYVRQAILLLLLNLLPTLAMLIGFFLVIGVMTFIPILLVFAGVPLIILPISWFALVAIKKTESAKES